MSDRIVLELGLTAEHVRTLRWILICWLGKYEENESSEYKRNAQAIFDALE